MNSSQNKKKKKRRGISRRLKRTLRILIPVLIVLFLLRAIVGLFLGGHSKKQEDGRDIIPPEIILEHREDYYVIPGLSYEEEGYRASDDRDGDLTDKVERSQDGDFIIYKVADQAGNVTVRYRKIPLLDPETGKAAVPEDSYDVLVSSRENEDGDAGGPADDPADGSGSGDHGIVPFLRVHRGSESHVHGNDRQEHESGEHGNPAADCRLRRDPDARGDRFRRQLVRPADRDADEPGSVPGNYDPGRSAPEK